MTDHTLIERLEDYSFKERPLREEAAARIRVLEEALAYARTSLGDPLPIGRRHVARVIDAALSPPDTDRGG